MESLFLFLGAMIAIVMGTLIWYFRGFSMAEVKQYFTTHTGKGIMKGILLTFLVVGVLGVTSLVFAGGKYFNDVGVYAGLESTKNVSPMCVKSGRASASDRLTSNLGIVLNIYESEDEKFRANAKYTHHSCAYNEDDKNYDAIGVELEYKLWQRK